MDTTFQPESDANVVHLTEVDGHVVDWEKVKEEQRQQLLELAQARLTAAKSLFERMKTLHDGFEEHMEPADKQAALTLKRMAAQWMVERQHDVKVYSREAI